MAGTGVKLRGELREDEPLARHTTWRVGGPARRLYINTGTASALDIARLIDLVRGQVEQRTGVRLVPEVRILGGDSA